MKIYYDFHIHSCLSPCGDNDMTPNNIVNMALLSGLSAIAITDHNTCRNCVAAEKVAAAAGLTFLSGMELCTVEEAHVVCLFPSAAAALAFEETVKTTLPPLPNRPDIFGEQLICDEEDNVVEHYAPLLATATDISVDNVVELVKQFGGAAFPAHIDRPSFSITAALGTLPPLGFAVTEATHKADPSALCEQYAEAHGKPMLLNSDAHYLEHIREAGAWLDLPDNTPETILAALRGDIPCEWAR